MDELRRIELAKHQYKEVVKVYGEDHNISKFRQIREDYARIKENNRTNHEEERLRAMIIQLKAGNKVVLRG